MVWVGMAGKRCSQLNKKFWRALKEMHLDKTIAVSDYTKVTIETLRKVDSHSVKLLTFPHNLILKKVSDFESVKNLAANKFVIFTFDPSKLMLEHINPGIAKTSLKTLEPSNIDPTSIKADLNRFAIHPKIARQLLDSSCQSSMDELWKSVSKAIIHPKDLLTENVNIRNSLLYLMSLSVNDPSSTRICFGGFPDIQLRLKIAELIPREQLLVAILNFLKFRTKYFLEQQFKPSDKVFLYDEMANFRLILNTEFVKGKYIAELATEAAKAFDQDVLIFTEPFFKNQLTKHSNLELFNSKMEAIQKDAKKMEEIQRIYNEEANRLNAEAKEIGLDLNKNEEEDDTKKLDPIRSKYLNADSELDAFDLDFEKFRTIEKIKVSSALEVEDMFFKLALWEVFHSDHGVNEVQFEHMLFFLDFEDIADITKVVSSLRQQYDNYVKSLREVFEKIIGQILKYERIMTIEEIYETLTMKTGVSLEDFHEFVDGS